jgi:hypothetical protein
MKPELRPGEATKKAGSPALRAGLTNLSILLSLIFASSEAAIFIKSKAWAMISP